MFNRRQFLTTAALTGGTAMLLPAIPATAQGRPDTTTPAGWLDWVAAHRDSVTAVVDNGAGRKLTHREYVPQVLGSSIKVVHLAAYTTAVAEGRIDPAEPVRLGDWDARHPWVGDGRAHYNALTALNIPRDELGIALDPEQRVPLDTLAGAMIDFSDNAATDYLRARLGDRALRKAAAAGGWREPDLRSLQGEVLLLILPEHSPPPGAPVVLRRRIGDRLAAKFVRERGFRDQVAARIPSMPATYDAQTPWARQHGRGSAADLFGMHRALATGDFVPADAIPAARRHLSRGLAGAVPDGATSIDFKGGSLPRSITAGMSLHWPDRRAGTLAILLGDVDEADFANAGAFLALCVSCLHRPADFDGLARALRR